jgi:hypothetical protein
VIKGGSSFITSQPYTVSLKERLPAIPSGESRGLVIEEENESKLNCYMVTGGLDLISLGCGEKNNGAIGIIQSDMVIGSKSFMVEGESVVNNGSYVDCIYEEIESNGNISYRERFPIPLDIDTGYIREYMTLVETTPSFYYYKPSLRIKNILEIESGFEVSINGGSTWSPVNPTTVLNEFALLRIGKPLTRNQTLVTYSVVYRVPVNIKGNISIDGYRSFSVNSDVPYRIKVAIKTKPGSIGDQVKMNEIYLLVK